MTEKDDKLARYLDGGSRVSRAYRGLDAPQPPAALSAKVLAEARDALEDPRGGAARRPGWMVPLSLAATLVIAVSIAFQTLPSRKPATTAGDLEPGARGVAVETTRQVSEPEAAPRRARTPRPELTVEREPLPVAPGRIHEGDAREAIASASEEIRRDAVQIEPPALPAPPTRNQVAETDGFAPPPPETLDGERGPRQYKAAEVEAETGVQADAIRAPEKFAAAAESVTIAGAADGAPQPETMAAAIPDVDDSQSADARLRRERFEVAAPDEDTPDEDITIAAAERARGDSADRSFGMTAPALDEKSERAARQWLADIRALHEDGRIAEAERSLERFRERFPDYPLPEDFPLPDPADPEPTGN